MRHLWNAVGALLLAACIMAACDDAQAQTVCRHWTDGFGLNMEGTPTQGCNAAAANFAAVYPDRAPVTVTSCVFTTVLTVGVQLSSPSDTGTLTVNDSGACTGEPEPDPEPTGDTIITILRAPDSVLEMTPEDAVQISWLVIGLWCIGWVTRTLIRTVPREPSDDD